MRDILLIRFSSLGDVVMATAVTEAIFDIYPEASVHVLTKKIYAPIFECDRRIESVIGIEEGDTPAVILKLLNNKEYDAVLDLHNSLRSRAVTALMRRSRLETVKKFPLMRRLKTYFPKLNLEFDTLGQYLDTVSFLGVKDRIYPKITPKLEWTEEALSKIGQKKVFGYAPGAKHDEKRWTERHFATVADRMCEKGYTPVFLGDEGDTGTVNSIRNMMDCDPLDLTGQLSLGGTIGAITLLKGLLTNDTGPMHIAGALNVPFVAIYGPTHPCLGFAPGYLSGTVIFSSLPCSPCSAHGEKPCRKKTRECMETLSVERVIEEIDHSLSIHKR